MNPSLNIFIYLSDLLEDGAPTLGQFNGSYGLESPICDCAEWVNCGAGTSRIEAFGILQEKTDDTARRIVEDDCSDRGRRANRGRRSATVDLADKAANSYTKEFLFGQTNIDRSMLQLIDDAIQRIKLGSYGTCIECEEELQQKRLEAVPWARHCVVCAEKHEQGLL